MVKNQITKIRDSRNISDDFRLVEDIDRS
jgi:hypothetical protein